MVRPGVVRPAWRFPETKTCRLGVTRVVVRLIWWSRTLEQLSTVGIVWKSPPRPQVASTQRGHFQRRRATRGRWRWSTRHSRAMLGNGAGGVHQTFSVIAAFSRVCTDQISRTRTLPKDTTTGFDLRKTPRRSKDPQVALVESIGIGWKSPLRPQVAST